MALTTKRIIALPAQTDPQEGDYLAIDNATSGTHKIPVGRIGVEVDDTLTEQGKAADAKAVGDALDEIRSQIEVTGTASGAIATFTDGSAMPAKSVLVNIEPKQSGTGTPSPTNVRPISGWESVNVYVSPTQEATDGTTKTVNLGRTVYGGEAEIVGGSLTDKMGVADLGTLTYADNGTIAGGRQYSARVNDKAFGEMNILSDVFVASDTTVNIGTMRGRENSNYVVFNSDIMTVADFKTAMNGHQLVYELATPQTYTLTGQEVETLLGENNVWADSGDVEVVYVRDLNITINNLLNSNGTRSLGMMAMSAPTEEPTDEQSDEQSDEDMR